MTVRLELALTRQRFDVARINPQVVADQQKIPDTFTKLGLLPKPVTISEAVAGF